MTLHAFPYYMKWPDDEKINGSGNQEKRNKGVHKFAIHEF